ncbi:MAG: YdhR family protein [bacterium]|nr:YdhR family protein [bacterium]
MARNVQFPPLLLARAVSLALQGRIRFVGDSVGDTRQCNDEEYVVFRKVCLAPARRRPDKPGALFTVTFRFAAFSAGVNRILSLIPIPFILAQPGFRSKTWLLGRRSGLFQGLYEWDSAEDAESYWTSFPMRMMKRRAVPETLTRETRAIRDGE